MSESAVLEIGQQALMIVMIVAGPLLAASLIVGILVSLVQVATSLQDVTLTFVPKIIAVGLTLVLAGGWMLHVLLDFTSHLLSNIPVFVR